MMAKLNRFLSFDAVMAGAVSLSCTWTLLQAYAEGFEPLKNHLPAESYVDSERRLQLSASLCQRLEQEGYIVIDNFLTLEEVRKASKSIEQLEATHAFQVTPNERDARGEEEQVRTDKVCFFGGNNSSKALNNVRHLLRSVGLEVTRSDFKGFTDDDTGESDHFLLSSHQLFVPDMMQVSVYDAIRKNDAIVGSYYNAHVDACSDTIESLGFLGFLKSRYLRQRYLTCIVYLNEHWEDSHGGCLRVYPGNAVSPIDIEPMAGRLVLFSSVSTEHAVLPTFSRRLACSVWLTLES
jgi:2OG-Fe(II) oxygenase superfamily